MDLLTLEIPDPIANLQLPEPALVTYYQNLNQRKIWLDSELDIHWLEYGRMILQWNKEDYGKPIEDRIPIKLYFFSPGGDLDVNYFFIDVIRLSTTPVIGINMGIAFSGGAFTYLACHKRYVLPSASFLFHSGSADGIGGTAQQVDAIAAQYKKQIKLLKNYLVERGLPKKLVDSKMRGEWFMDAAESVEIGVADKIVENIDEII